MPQPTNYAEAQEAIGVMLRRIEEDEAKEAAVKATSDSAETTRQGWLTVSDAATVAGCNRGVISRAADAGNLKSNGKKNHDRRIDAADLSRWILQQSQKPEQGESDEGVEAKMKKAQIKK